MEETQMKEKLIKLGIRTLAVIGGIALLTWYIKFIVMLILFNYGLLVLE